MSLQEIIGAIDHLLATEIEAVKAHLLERQAALSSEPENNDLESMAGIFHADGSLH